MQWFDDFFEARSRRAAQSISRRSASKYRAVFSSR